MKADSGSSERSAGSEAEPRRAGVSRGLITGTAGWGTSILRSGKGQGLEGPVSGRRGRAGPPPRRQPPVPGERSGLGCLNPSFMETGFFWIRAVFPLEEPSLQTSQQPLSVV
ncbi:unnamed protein product [Arctogadus glacialis]